MNSRESRALGSELAEEWAGFCGGRGLIDGGSMDVDLIEHTLYADYTPLGAAIVRFVSGVNAGGNYSDRSPGA